MRKFLIVLCLLSTTFLPSSAQSSAHSDWKAKVAEIMPLLGHRNWILIVDSAYPLQTGPGIETIETNANQLEVVRHVLFAINRSIHVRPDISMDAELPFVPDKDAPGASAYRTEISSLLRGYQVESQPHNKIIASIAETATQFHVLVLKTNMTIPYTSLFIRLNCKYWSDDAETRMRARMTAPGSSH